MNVAIRWGAMRATRLLLSALLLVSGCTKHEKKTKPPAAPAVKTLSVQLVGSAEAPTSGDPDGTGKGTVRFDDAKKAICVDLTVDKLDPIAAVHLQQGQPGQPGPIVVPLPSPPGAGTSITGCAAIDDVRYAAVKAKPEMYFINVRTTAYPAGAIRGQLAGGNGPARSTIPSPPTGPPTFAATPSSTATTKKK